VSVARASTKRHWEDFWEGSQAIDDVYDNGGRVLDGLDRARAALGAAADLRGLRVLEVGAGSGRDSLELVRRGAQVWVVDYTPSALQLIGRQPGGNRLLRVCGDAFQLPFAAGSFDVVFHQGLLEHFRQPAGLLAENARVLARGGLLLVDVPQRWHYYTPLKHLLIAFDRWFAGWRPSSASASCAACCTRPACVQSSRMATGACPISSIVSAAGAPGARPAAAAAADACPSSGRRSPSCGAASVPHRSSSTPA
jgi:SAM-dependent methyltransferase